MFKTFAQTLTNEDRKIIVAAVREASIHYGSGYAENVVWPKGFLKGLEKRHGAKIPQLGHILDIIVSDDEELRDAVRDMSSVRDDRFYALKLALGNDEQAAAITQILKRYYIEKILSEAAASSPDIRAYARRQLENFVQKHTKPEISQILMARSRHTLGSTLERQYFSADDHSEVSRAIDLPLASHLSRGISRTGEGKIRAVPIKPGRIGDGGAEGFARAVMGEETGKAAQAKNPRPREGNSLRPKPLKDLGDGPS